MKYKKMKNKIPLVSLEKYQFDSPIGHIQHKFINRKSSKGNISFEITNAFFHKNEPIPSPTLIQDPEKYYKITKNIKINNHLSQSKLYPSSNKELYYGSYYRFQTSFQPDETNDYQEFEFQNNNSNLRPFGYNAQSIENKSGSKTFKKKSLDHKDNIEENRYPSNYGYLESKYTKKKGNEKKIMNLYNNNNNICFVDSSTNKVKSDEKNNPMFNLSLNQNLNKSHINYSSQLNNRYDEMKNNNHSSLKNEKSYNYYKIHKETINTLVNSTSQNTKKNFILKSINYKNDKNNNDHQPISQYTKITVKTIAQPRTPSINSQNKYFNPLILEAEKQYNELINEKKNNNNNTERNFPNKSSDKVPFKKLVFTQNRNKNIIKYKKRVESQDDIPNTQINVTMPGPFRPNITKTPMTSKQPKIKNMLKKSINYDNNDNNNKYNNNVIVSITDLKENKNNIKNNNNITESKQKPKENTKSKTQLLFEKHNLSQNIDTSKIKDDNNVVNLKDKYLRRPSIQAMQILTGNKTRRYSTQNTDIVATVLNKIKNDNYNNNTKHNNNTTKNNDKKKEKEKEKEKDKDKEKQKDNNKLKNNNNNNNKGKEISETNIGHGIRHKYNLLKKKRNNNEDNENKKEIEKKMYDNPTEPKIQKKSTYTEKKTIIHNKDYSDNNDNNDNITNKSLNLNYFSKDNFVLNKEMKKRKNNKSFSDIKKCQINNTINININSINNNNKTNINSNNINNKSNINSNNNNSSNYSKNNNYYSISTITSYEHDKKAKNTNYISNNIKNNNLNNSTNSKIINNNNLNNSTNSKVINSKVINNNINNKALNNKTINNNHNGNTTKNEEKTKTQKEKKKNIEDMKKMLLTEKKEKPNYSNIAKLTINATTKKNNEKSHRYQSESLKHEKRINEFSKNTEKKKSKHEEEWDNIQYKGMRKKTYDAGIRAGKKSKNKDKHKKYSGSLKDVFTSTQYVKSSEGFSLAGKNEKGNKKTNQDTYVIERNVNGILNFNIFGVMDGHGDDGHFASQFVSRYVVHRIKTHPLIKKLDEPKEIYEVLISNGYEIIANIYLDADVQIQKEKFDCTRSGTTIVLVIQLEEHIICANTGDSRAILIYDECYDDNLVNSKIFPLSYDCKPELPEEKKRIYESGGVVEKSYYSDDEDDPIIPYRVWAKDEDYPGLAMSRSIGDMDAKKVGVIPNPQIVEYTIDYFSKYILICSDGIWEFMKNEEAMKIGNKYYLRNDPVGLCHELTQESIKLWEKREIVIDDITVVVVFF